MMASDALTVRRHVRFSSGERGRRKLRSATSTATPPPAAAIPRISRLMALAIVLDEVVRAGKATSYAELARIAHVSRSRLAQIAVLANLAPDIQEALLFLDSASSPTETIAERQLRPVAATSEWTVQRELYARMPPR